MKALIVGATSPIGQAVCRSLDGYYQTRTWHATKPPNDTVLDDVARGHDWHQLDATDPAAVFLFCGTHPFDVVVNCAGVQHNARTQNLDPTAWRRVLATNLDAAFYLTRFTLPHMINQGHGRIVHISSMAGRLPLQGAVAYAASKAGLEGMVRTAATDVASKGVTINAVAPGPLTEGMGAALTDKAEAAMMARIPARRFGTVQNVADTVRFLIDTEWINGQTIPVDGGMW